MRIIQERGLLLVGLALAAPGFAASGCGAPDPESAGVEGEVADEAQALEAGRDFTRDPPDIQAVAISPLANDRRGNALILATVTGREQLPAQIQIHLEGRSITLRNDGREGDQQAQDLVYSAITSLGQATVAEVRANASVSSVEDDFWMSPSFVGRDDVEATLMSRPDSLDALRLPDLFPVLPPTRAPVPVDPGRSLLINAPSVVADPGRTVNPCTGQGTPMGKWTFGHLMTQMANERATGVRPSDFVTRWLQHWTADQTVNGLPVPRREEMARIVDAWPRLRDGSLDLARAPFNLLAIVNRVDLRENLVYGGGSAGEARFIFGVVDTREGRCEPMRFSVILEYGIEEDSCEGARAWAKQWADLSRLTIGSGAYRAALEAITSQFTAAGAAPRKPNGSALNQLRTNEIALTRPWELREFQIAGGDRLLHEVPVKQTPDIKANNTARLGDYMAANAAAIREQKHTVPMELPAGSPFLEGAAPAPTPDFFWQAPGAIDYETRRGLSLGTCNGCHTGETGTQFVHVEPFTRPGQQAALSRFLTGMPDGRPFVLQDPAGTRGSIDFADLKRRKEDLERLVGSSCLLEMKREPLLMTH